MDYSEKMILPAEYLSRMKELLGDEFEAFADSYALDAVKGLRFNTKKVRTETVDKLINSWRLEPVPWCSDGYYYSGDLRPGLSPYHDAGVYYIQEPSAMITAELADIGEDDIVLDLCAAPGGKSTQAATRCNILVSNEPIASRARILSSNIERMGFSNCVVTSAYPDELASVKALHGFFDRIIVDAPCSGEGMMRKDETAVREWSEANVALCIERQAEILEQAAGMLKPGGKLAYSTCTFEKGENEDQIEDFLKKHDDFKLIKEHRLWPHKDKGEGHFCAVLMKCCDESENETRFNKKNKLSDAEDIAKALKKAKLHVLRYGIEAGEQKTDKKGKSYYTPSHAEALAKCYETDNGGKIDFISDELCERYLKGESFTVSDYAENQDYTLLNSKEGWVTVYYDRYPLGNAKIVNGVLKNHYPKGLRRLG